MTDKLSALKDYYDVIDHRNASTILEHRCGSEFDELIKALLEFRLTHEMLLAPGGNESAIPKIFSSKLRQHGWKETRISGDLLIKLKSSSQDDQDFTIENYLDGHKIDYVKNRVAFDLEWNAKDQTFDRDLYAFRSFYEAGVIDAAILVTRAEDLNDEFKRLGIMQKYGASTTWMGKLVYRLNANRGGGCPVLALGITKRLIDNG